MREQLLEGYSVFAKIFCRKVIFIVFGYVVIEVLYAKNTVGQLRNCD